VWTGLTDTSCLQLAFDDFPVDVRTIVQGPTYLTDNIYFSQLTFSHLTVVVLEISYLVPVPAL